MQRWETERRTQRPIGRHQVIAAVATAIITVACTGGSAVPTATTSLLEGTTTPTPAHSATDGVLRIGLLLPETGPGEIFGDALGRAAGLAVSEINLHGGVGGRDVEVVRRDEGSDIATAGRAMGELIDAGVDVIVGPASSNVTLGVLRQAVDARRVVCSPTASAISLDGFPDSGYFLRTIPSDRLQTVALAELISRSGSRTASVLFPDDEFGEGFEASIRQELNSRGVDVHKSIAYKTAATDVTALVGAVADGHSDVLVVIGDVTSGSRVLQAIAEGTDTQIPIFVNDALRRSPLAATAATRPLLSRVRGVSALAVPEPGAFVTDMTAVNPQQAIDYSAYAYDCVMLAALATVSTGGDDPALTIQAMADVSSQGVRCFDFATCSAQLVPSYNIDFDGPSGRIELNPEGEVTSATFEEFAFDEAGRDIPVGKIPINP